MSAQKGRFVIHLPVEAYGLEAAQRIARVMGRVMGRTMRVLRHVDTGEITVSAEDAQGVRHRVFCDRLLPAGRRCLLRATHDGPCSRRLPR